jgi:hypothetical protein
MNHDILAVWTANMVSFSIEANILQVILSRFQVSHSKIS